jgi:pimeloyl-ACP methyl ester carboxylesterase
MTWIFLPGMDGTGDLVAPVTKELARDDVCIVARYPRARVCHRAELFSIAREALPDFEDYVLVAESFSGQFALEIASRRPKRLRALILVASFASSPIPLFLMPLVYLCGPIALRISLPAIVTRRFLTGPHSSPEQIEVVRDAVNSVKAPVLASRLKMVLRSDAADLLGQINVPTLVIGAENDRLVPRKVTAQLSVGIPGARLEWINAPHLAMLTKPRAVADVMQQFVRGVEQLRSNRS